MINTAGRTHYYDFSKFRLDVSNRLLYRNGEHIALTQKSFELLCFLVRNRNRMLKKQEILEEVWNGSFVEEANLAQHIYMVRKALKENDASADYIETIPKFGYRFNCEVFEGYADSLCLEQENGNAVLNGTASLASFRSAATTNGFRAPAARKRPARKSYRLPVLAASAISVAVFAAAIAAFAFAYFTRPADSRDLSAIRSISVLPFDQIGGEKDEKLSLGLADTLISRLGGQDTVSILPTSTITRFRDDDRPPLEVGRDLGVDAILTGTIQIEGARARINVQLISVAARAPVWTARIDSSYSDVFKLQDQVSGEVASKLVASFNGTPDRTEPQFVEQRDPAALQAFEKGLYFWKKRTGENLSKAIGHFAEAVKIDPRFARAHALLADAYALRAIYGRDSAQSDENISLAAEAVARSLELDSTLSEAYSAKAIVAQYEKNAGAAFGLLKKAVALDPENAVARLRLAWIHAVDDDLPGAIREMKLAQKSDPDSQVINLNLARLLRLNRQTDEALEFGRRALKLDPSMMWTRVILAEIYEQKGMLDESQKELESVPRSAPENNTAQLLLSRVLVKKGKKEEARKLLESVTQQKPAEAPSYELASVYAVLGETREAVEELQNSDGASLIHYLHVKYDSNLDALRNDPEFPGIVTQSRRKFIRNYDKNS